MNQLSIVTDRERDIAERLAKAEQQRDELAAQVEGMRWQRYELMGVLADLDNGDEFDGTCKNTLRRVVDVLSLPNTSAAILRQRDARTLREAAEELYAIADDDGPEHSWGPRACAYSSAADKLNAKANELLAADELARIVTDRERDLAERLADAQRLICDLVGQVLLMRDALTGAAEYTALLDDFTQAAIREAMAVPTEGSCAAILRQRDARTLREAADIAVQWGDARTDDQGGHALRNYAARIRNMAAELESKNG